jgi:hypothetical protein
VRHNRKLAAAALIGALSLLALPAGAQASVRTNSITAITHPTRFHQMVLDSAAGPTTTQSDLTLTGPASVQITKSVSLTGKLVLSTGATPPAGTQITITRTAAGTAAKTFTVATAANGTFALKDTPPVYGAYTYTAQYAGSATNAPATASHKLSVTRISTVLKMTTGTTTFNDNQTIHITVRLGPTYTNRTVSVYSQWFTYQGKSLIKTARVNSRGTLTLTYRSPHTTNLSVVFAGDAHYAPRTYNHPVYVRASLGLGLSGFYGSAVVGNIRYLLFHHNKTMYSAVTVSPNKHGECVDFEVQEFYQNAWNNNVATGCLDLNKSSKYTVPWNLTGANLGYPYRIRVAYLRSAKDNSNLGNQTGWQYFMVET